MPKNERDQDYVRANKPKTLRILLGAVLGAFLLVGWMSGTLNRLWTQTGMQWDQEMSGDWARQTVPENVGIEIYRIHIVDNSERELRAEMREFAPVDKLAVAFHFRTKSGGNFDARVQVLDRSGTVVASGEKLGVPNAGQNFKQFSGIVVPIKLPESTGSYKLRLEVSERKSTSLAFWETDIQLAYR